MRKNFVLTLTGADRIGIVESLTKILLDRGGNVETSRMARLGGEFAVLMLVSLPEEQFADLDGDLAGLVARGYKVTTATTGQIDAESQPGGPAYQIEVHGADHEGIIHRVSHYLSRRGINVESMDTGTIPAPTSGVPLFTMTARVAVPPDLAGQDWEAGLETLGDEMNLEIHVGPVENN